MLEDLSLLANLAIFGAAAVTVWLAGARLAHSVDGIAEKTGVGRGFLGIVLLGGVTSLPEMAVSYTASFAGHSDLAVNNLLGSASFNIIIIAVADALIGRDAITSVLASANVLLQGVLGIVMLVLVAAATLSPDVPLLGASVWTWLLVAVYASAVWILARSRSEGAWKAISLPTRPRPTVEAFDDQSLRKEVGKTAAAAAVILVAGFFLSQTGEAIARQTGLGTSFVGFLLVGAATSLPEVSTVLAAVRLHRYEMALGDVFGASLLNVAHVFGVDVLFEGGPVLQGLEGAGRFAGFAALLAAVLVGIFLIGMLERRDRTIARMGYDSLAAVIVYVAGVALLWQLR
jgi:cation:H+ antiporter